MFEDLTAPCPPSPMPWGLSFPLLTPVPQHKKTGEGVFKKQEKGLLYFRRLFSWPLYRPKMFLLHLARFLPRGPDSHTAQTTCNRKKLVGAPEGWREGFQPSTQFLLLF